MTEKIHAFRNASSANEWLNCGEWPILKRQAIAEEWESEPAGAHAERGTKLHDITETILRKWIAKNRDNDVIEKMLKAKLVTSLDDHDQEMIERAVWSVVALVEKHDPDGVGQIGLELEVPLAHEPESVGFIDFTLAIPGVVLVVEDHKFGLGEVLADSYQNRIYASSLTARLEAKGITFPLVVLAIVQPELSVEAIVEETTMEELAEFRAFVNTTVERQEEGIDERGASSPRTCTFCPFKLRKCQTHARFISESLDDAEEVFKGTAFPDTVERFYRSKKMIEESLSIARKIILEDPDGFEGWSRSESRNARAWALDRFEETEIAHILRRDFDIKDPYKLLTPAAMKKMLPTDADLEPYLQPETMREVLRQKKGS
jgi:hypothetical protein